MSQTKMYDPMLVCIYVFVYAWSVMLHSLPQWQSLIPKEGVNVVWDKKILQKSMTVKNNKNNARIMLIMKRLYWSGSLMVYLPPNCAVLYDKWRMLQVMSCFRIADGHIHVSGTRGGLDVMHGVWRRLFFKKKAVEEIWRSAVIRLLRDS